MKSKQLLLTAVCAVISIYAAAEEIIPPRVWKASKASFTVSDNVITVKANGGSGGINGRISNVENKRCKVTFMVKGSGTVQAALNGFSGMAYSRKVKLSDEWKSVELSYFNTQNKSTLYIYSVIANAAEFQVKDIAVTTCEMPELADADIAAKLFLPAEFPGENGKLYSKKDSSVGKAVWGKRWYNVMKLPVPANSKPLYYYIHAQKTGDVKCAVNLRAESQNVYTTAVTAPANQWQWVKVGPVNALAVYPEFYINYSVSDTKTVIWVDKVVLSTNPAMSDADLDKAE